MKSVIASMVAVAGLAVVANAIGPANTRMNIEVSLDGITFTPTVAIPTTGATVQVRVSVSYIGPAFSDRIRTDTLTNNDDPDNPFTFTQTSNHHYLPGGFSSLVFQPTINNLAAGDAGTAFDNGGAGSNTSAPAGVVAAGNAGAGHYGRITPWGRTAITGLTAFIHTNPSNSGDPANGGGPGTFLRVAQPQVATWIGGAGNTSGGSGVNLAQLGAVGRTGSDPSFSRTTTNVRLFRFGIVVGGAHASSDVMTIDAPYGGFGNVDTDGGTGDRQAYWWGFDQNGASGAESLTTGLPSEQTGSFRGTVQVVTGSITFLVPTPSSMALLGLGGLVMARRRR